MNTELAVNTVTDWKKEQISYLSKTKCIRKRVRERTQEPSYKRQAEYRKTPEGRAHRKLVRAGLNERRRPGWTEQRRAKHDATVAKRQARTFPSAYQIKVLIRKDHLTVKRNREKLGEKLCSTCKSVKNLKEFRSKPHSKGLWVDYECISCDNSGKRAKYGKDPRKKLLSHARKRALMKGLPFNLTKEDIVIPGYCPVFGFLLRPNIGGKAADHASPSLDRIVPSLGYVKGNVQVISHLANGMKSSGTYEHMILMGEWAKKRLEEINKKF